MAVVYCKQTKTTRYEIRSAGASLRLYTNGAFHSQYNPNVLFTGGVWDLLSFPALFQATSPDTVLMLGVGGGTAIHQLNELFGPAQIIGLEWDKTHLQLARRYFKVCGKNISLIQADAFQWLAETSKENGMRYDLVVDDLFVDAPGDPQRPFTINKHWLDSLDRQIAPQGMLIQNHLSEQTARLIADQLNGRFASCLLFTLPNYHNAVLAAYRQPLALKGATRLATSRLQDIKAKRRNRLRWSARQLF